MDPPGSSRFQWKNDDDDDENYSNDNNDDDDDDAVDHHHHNLDNDRDEVLEVSPHADDHVTTDVPILSAAAATADNNDTGTTDDDIMRTSLSAATRNYEAHIGRGGYAMTSKGSIDSTRVLVQIPTSDHPTRMTTTTNTFEPNTPIIATLVPNDPPIIVSPPQQEQHQLPDTTLSSSERSPVTTEQAPLQEQARSHEQTHKYSMMVERLVSELGYPTGLAQRLVTCVQTQFVKHYWLVDNSGSMLTSDCVRMVQKDILDVGAANARRPKKLYDTVKCSRWNELENTLLSHIELARILEVPTTFRLLKGQKGVQEFTINQEADDIDTAKSIIRQSEPDGVTLLSDHIIEICNHIEKDKDVLLEKGQRAVVVIATDAIPSDLYGESCDEAKTTFFNALKILQLLPVWIVIRLCTNDRKAIQYYRKLDKKLEIPIECVSDFINENKEVRKWNPWLNYTQQIHQCREMGFHHRVFDLLDERPFTKDDLSVFLTILFGTEIFDPNVSPNMHSNWKEFLQYLKNQVLTQCEKYYSPSTKKIEDIIDVKGLATAHWIFGSLRNTLNKIEY